MRHPKTKRIALVTGSTSGIGLGIARSLAAEGHDVYLHGLGSAAEISELQTSLAREFDVRIAVGGQDLSSPEGAAEMVRDCRAQLGDVDILVNNAGIQYVAPVEEFPLERWHAILNINLTSAFVAAKEAIPAMKAKRFGRIINVASAHGLVASAQKSAYVAAKHGLVGLTKVIALENARIGVTCNAICPGWVRTPLVEKQIQAKADAKGVSFEEATEELLAEKQPSLQFVTPEQLGALAVFLASPAASQMTGSVVSVDGGWTAQ